MSAATSAPTQATKRGSLPPLAPTPKKRKPAAVISTCILTTNPIRRLDAKTVAQLRIELDGMDWSAPRAKKFNHNVPRDQIVVSEDGLETYFYGSGDLPRAVWPPAIKRLAVSMSTESDTEYNMILINRYVDGKDSVSWHADDEKNIDQDAPIVSVSIGASRYFHIRKTRMGEEHHGRCRAPDHTTMLRKGVRMPKKVGAKLLLDNGSYIVMPPGFQSRHEHAVLKTKKEVGVRYNLTLRKSL